MLLTTVRENCLISSFLNLFDHLKDILSSLIINANWLTLMTDTLDYFKLVISSEVHLILNTWTLYIDLLWDRVSLWIWKDFLFYESMLEAPSCRPCYTNHATGLQHRLDLLRPCDQVQVYLGFEEVGFEIDLCSSLRAKKKEGLEAV